MPVYVVSARTISAEYAKLGCITNAKLTLLQKLKTIAFILLTVFVRCNYNIHDSFDPECTFK